MTFKRHYFTSILLVAVAVVLLTFQFALPRWIDYQRATLAKQCRLARNNDDSRPQSIERYVALRGTTDTEELRDIRREALQKERYEVSNLINQVTRLGLVDTLAEQ